MMARFPRSCGVLLHPTSLPGRFGIGDLGFEAYRFADFLASSGQKIWQVLPIGPTGYGDSPYQCFSAFAGNTLLISPDLLQEIGLLSRKDLDELPQLSGIRADYPAAIALKEKLLDQAFSNFKHYAKGEVRNGFEAFKNKACEWLDEYALFRAIKEAHGEESWDKWEHPLKYYDSRSLEVFRGKFSERIEAHKFFQYLFFRQWMDLKNYCAKNGIKIIGDMPIFVAYDSVDVWGQRELFKLSPEGRPIVVAGVPPDYFSATGQLWGNPLFDWDRLMADGNRWWIKRFRWSLELFNIIRIDHFRGFAGCWEIPGDSDTAERGRWVSVPGWDFFSTVEKEIGKVAIIAEDLGVITPDVEALRDGYGFPGMRILQFAFNGGTDNLHLPHNHIHNCVVYTGTHDNDTTLGWYKSIPGAGSTRSLSQIRHEHHFCLKYLRTNARNIHWDFIRAIYASVADTAIVPLQDILGLDSSARMNLPGTSEGNWAWRFNTDALDGTLADNLHQLAMLYGRA